MDAEPIPDRTAARSAIIRALAERLIADWLATADNPNNATAEDRHARHDLCPLLHRPPEGDLLR